MAKWWWWQAFKALAPAPILKLPPWDGAAPIPLPWPSRAALGADKCEIYTDVPGILDHGSPLGASGPTDGHITCDEMLELASLGAKVLHPRAVEIARNYGVPASGAIELDG
jgi:hypothetical protein